jgi:type IV secretory pathway TrbL component
MKLIAIPGAKAAATKKIQAWAGVQMKAQAKKLAARAAGNKAADAAYFKAEIFASCRRAKHEDALYRIDRWEREQAELAAWEARRAARR